MGADRRDPGGIRIRRATTADIPALNFLDMTVFSPDSLALDFRSNQTGPSEVGGFCRWFRARSGPPYQRRYIDWDWGELEDFRRHLDQGLVWVAQAIAAEEEPPTPLPLLGVVEAAEPVERTWGHEPDGSVLELVSLFVDRGHRRQGVGRALVEQVIAEARRRRKELVITQAESGNLAAIRFYLSLGFVLQGLAFLRPEEGNQGEAVLLLVYHLK
ncbi:MAG: GNAT family N-acetyltransferase [Limnochordales bacterium]|nr:GNAT family N-acetyltransferase [Limnochordales bacterium]